MPQAAAYFYRPDGSPWPVGQAAQPGAGGSAAADRGTRQRGAAHRPGGGRHRARVRGHAGPGPLTLADLAGYRAAAARAAVHRLAARLAVCGFPPPSSGHLAVMQILGLLERLAGSRRRCRTACPGRLAACLHRSRAAGLRRPRAVRGRPRLRARPGRPLDQPARRRLPAQRAALIGPRSMGTATPGQPAGERRSPGAPHAGAARARHQPHQHRRRRGPRGGHDQFTIEAAGARGS
jgi:gamma-glutamyltranspeptidase / glutathione hydrolase